MVNQKVHRLIGLCRRAGAMSYGFDGVLNDLKKNKARLILFANDISPKTKDEIVSYCKKTTMLNLKITKEELGNIIGTKPTGVLSINDENFKKGILEVNEFDEN